MATDEQIKKSIEDQLRWDDRIGPEVAEDIIIGVCDGCVVLSGTVSSHLVEQAAIEDARVVLGVTGVENNLDVRPIVTVSDREIKKNVKNVLSLNPGLRDSNIDVSVKDGIVVLKGDVDAFWKMNLAKDLAGDLVGVRGVSNELSVVPTKDVRDEEIAGNIKDVFARSGKVDVEMVNVEVKKGKVTLSGIVPDWAAHNIAYEAVLHTAGVKGIKDRIVIGKIE